MSFHSELPVRCAVLGCGVVSGPFALSGWTSSGQLWYCPNHGIMSPIAPGIVTAEVTVTVPPGTKHDNEKMRWALLMPWDGLDPVMRVLEFGAKKYAPNNWKKVEPIDRYLEAAMRHVIDLARGKKVDEESGESPAAHAVCDLLFYLARIKETK